MFYLTKFYFKKLFLLHEYSFSSKGVGIRWSEKETPDTFQYTKLVLAYLFKSISQREVS